MSGKREFFTWGKPSRVWAGPAYMLAIDLASGPDRTALMEVSDGGRRFLPLNPRCWCCRPAAVSFPAVQP